MSTIKELASSIAASFAGENFAVKAIPAAIRGGIDLPKLFDAVIEQSIILAANNRGNFSVKTFNKKQVGLYAGYAVPFRAVDLSAGDGQKIKRNFNAAFAALKTGVMPEQDEALWAWNKRATDMDSQLDIQIGQLWQERHQWRVRLEKEKFKGKLEKSRKEFIASEMREPVLSVMTVQQKQKLVEELESLIGIVAAVFEDTLKGENDPTPKGENDPTPKGENDPTPKGENDPTPKGENDPTPKGENDPTPKGENDPTPKGENDPTPKGENDPTPKGENDPTPKGENDPTPKGENDPTPKGENDPTPKGENDPTPKGENDHSGRPNISPKQLSKDCWEYAGKVLETLDQDKRFTPAMELALYTMLEARIKGVSLQELIKAA